MKIVAFLLVIGAAGYSSAQVLGFGGCPPVRPARDFDLERYFGRWYEIRRFYAVFYGAGSTCIQADYTPADEGRIRVVNTARSRDGGRIERSGYAYQPEEGVGAIKVQFYEGQEPGDYWVLDTDYESYALVHSCSEYFWGWFNLQFNWLLMRERVPTDEVIRANLRKFAELGINVNKFLVTDQRDCEYEPRPSERPGTDRPRPSDRPGTDRPRPSDEPGTDRPRPSDEPGTDRPRPSERPRTERPRPSEEPGTDRPRPSEEPGTGRPRPSEQPGTLGPRPGA